MASDWHDLHWVDIVSLEYGRALRGHGIGKGPFRVYGTNGPIGWHNEPLCLHPGVIIGRKGAYRGVHYSPAPFFVIDTAFYLEPKTKIDLRWAYYNLLTQEINTMDSGSAIPSTSRDAFYALPVRVPPLDEQRAIAHILGALDDKIELNRRMNETLEAIARAIFKSWFVDFDPVRAKMEGRWRRGESLPGLPAQLYDLFPDRFVESELGPIPEGWKVKKLSDLCTTQYGYTASAVDAPIGPKFLRVTDINKRNWIEWGDVPYCAIEPDLKASYALELGDLVVARMADPGKSAMIEEDLDAVFASYLVRLKTPSLAYSHYIYGFLKSELYGDYVEGAKSGSVQASMNAKVIVGADLVLPKIVIMEKFLQIVLPLRRRLVANVGESRTVVALRDTLLPKLISGQIVIKGAEPFLKERDP